jgi:hypothetical protein
MSETKSMEIRVIRIALIMLIWYSIGIAASSFSIGNILIAVIGLSASGLLMFGLIDKRLLKKLNERPMPRRSLIGLYGLMIILTYGGIRNLQLNEVMSV